MALLFSRLAHNFAKNGYYPTDEITLSRVLAWLRPSEQGTMRILDPAAGEGVALAEVKHTLGRTRVSAIGVEYDAERAYHAKTLLDCVVHGDFQDCIIGRRQYGLLWLNPPYGDLVSDKAQTGEKAGKGRPRLEKLFYQLALPALQFGGVLVLIIPRYTLDAEFAGWLSKHFDRVQVFAAPEQQFKQIVFFGLRKRVGSVNTHDASETTVKRWLESVGRGDVESQELPDDYLDEPYFVPAAVESDAPIIYTRMDAAQLHDEVQRHPCLWSQFEATFARSTREHRPPLRAMSDWHLALALAAGQVSGVVRSRDGRVFVIKGDTHKEKSTRVEMEERGKDKYGHVRYGETRILTDRFVPVIKAIDFTPDSVTFGRVLTIR